MSKGSKGHSITPVAGSLLTLAQRVVLGALCGVGLVWTVTALWTPSKSYVLGFGHHVSRFSVQYPVVLLGLMLGILVSLLWSAVKK
jgi:hypothetical protein